MASSAEVFDLVSSDDEVVVIDSKSAGKRYRESDIGHDSSSKKRRNSNELHLQANMGKIPSKEVPSLNVTFPADSTRSETTARVVMDEDGNINAVITYGILEVLDVSSTPGVITCIGKRSRDSQSTVESTLQHIQQRDLFSCGFRNLQMMLTALLPHLQPNHAFYQLVPRRFPNCAVPSLRQIETTLEQSWKAGFDPTGARHYGHKIVDRQSRIGAVEVSSVMSYWGLDSAVVQFIQCRESRELLPKFVRAYFTKALGKDGCPFCSSGSPRPKSIACAEELLQFASIPDDLQMKRACDCPLLPLYLQWEGHSVTVVGWDEDDSFLIFDPGQNGLKIKKDLEMKKIPSGMRLSVKPLLEKDIQVILCSTCSLTQADKQARRSRPSVATAADDAVVRASNSSRG
jgi:hypothetical protein